MGAGDFGATAGAKVRAIPVSMPRRLRGNSTCIALAPQFRSVTWPSPAANDVIEGFYLGPHALLSEPCPDPLGRCERRGALLQTASEVVPRGPFPHFINEGVPHRFLDGGVRVRRSADLSILLALRVDPSVRCDWLPAVLSDGGNSGLHGSPDPRPLNPAQHNVRQRSCPRPPNVDHFGARCPFPQPGPEGDLVQRDGYGGIGVLPYPPRKKSGWAGL